MAWSCSVVLLARLLAIVVRVSSRGVGISSLSLLRHNKKTIYEDCVVEWFSVSALVTVTGAIYSM